MPSPGVYAVIDRAEKNLEERLPEMTIEEIKKYHRRSKAIAVATGAIATLTIVGGTIFFRLPLAVPLFFVPYSLSVDGRVYLPIRDMINRELERRR